MFSIRSRGSFANTEAYLRRLANLNLASILQTSGQAGVNALASATPVSTSLAAHSWTFEIVNTSISCAISWHNTDVETGFPVAIMLQYGYATGTGGYVSGRDYINPAIKPIFDKIEADVLKAVTSV